jgi:NAD(P)-dependent dehydrogenase (short-subunit alcohol dehydrogenase family)
MSNQVVISITGASTGIGRAAAVAFAKKGAKVVVAGQLDETGKALVKELHLFGSEAEFVNADVCKEDDVRALVDKAAGPTDTGMLIHFTGALGNKAALVVGVPMGRLDRLEELADAIVFVASDEASFITGHILNADSGHSAN